MMVLWGKVSGIKKGLLEIDLKGNADICQKCHAHGLCGISYNKKQIKARNGCDAHVNDIVKIEHNSNHALWLAFIFYIFPLFMFFILYFIGEFFVANSTFSFVLAGIGFALVYLFIFFAVRNRKLYNFFLPVAIEKQNEADFLNG
jgi:positive regulator of sigma E activity